MPRLRRARTPEEALAVPPDKPLIVEVDGVDPADDQPQLQTGGTPPPPERTPPPAPPPEPEDDEAPESPLQKQIEAMRQAEELQKRELARLQAENSRLQQQHSTLTRDKEQAEYDSVVNALGGAQEAADRAQADFQAAYEAGDGRAVADAQRRLSTATARLIQLEDYKTTMDERREAAKTAPPPANDVHARIDQVPNLSGRSRDWLHQHPDVMTDPRKNARITAAHLDAIDAGHAQDSDGYFQFIEEKLGYRQSEPPPAPAPAPQPEPRRSPPVSAPVSRDAPNLTTGRPQKRNIELSAEQREHARIAGVDDFTYAKNLQELDRRKKLGMYPDR